MAALIAVFLLVENCIGILVVRLRYVIYPPEGGPRSSKHVRLRDTMNLSRVWVTVRVLNYFLPLFHPSFRARAMSFLNPIAFLIAHPSNSP